MSAETAVRLGRYMGTGAVLWMNLQTAYDVSVVEARQGAAINREVLPASPPSSGSSLAEASR